MVLPVLPKLGKSINGPQDLAAKGDCAYKLQRYDGLAENKVILFTTMNRLNLSKEEKRIIVAMAMQETTHMRLDQRDMSKDNSSAKNVSILNCNIDMMRQLGWTFDNGELMNTPQGLAHAVAYTVQGMRQWGVRRLLDFHRGGRTGFNDGVSYDCYGYRNAIATMLPLLRSDLRLARDNGFRIEISVKHV